MSERRPVRAGSGDGASNVWSSRGGSRDADHRVPIELHRHGLSQDRDRHDQPRPLAAADDHSHIALECAVHDAHRSALGQRLERSKGRARDLEPAQLAELLRQERSDSERPGPLR